MWYNLWGQVTLAGSFAVDFRDQFRKRRQRTFPTYRQAAAFEKGALALIARREYTGPSKETIEQICEKWLKRKIDAGTYKRSSLDNWRNHIHRYIVPELGHLKVYYLDIETVERAAAEWAKRASPKMANQVFTTLRAILSLAKRYRLIKDNPAAEAERLKLETHEEDGIALAPDRVYSKAELKNLIDATEPASQERVLIMVLSLTGVRIGEALGLTWPAVDLKAGTLSIVLNLAQAGRNEAPLFTSPKTQSSRRTLPLPQELVHELRVWKLKCPSSERGLVFSTEEGKPLYRKTASAILDAAIEKASVKRLTPHGLRHTFASLLLADGVPVTEVAAYLGHKDCGVTLKIYAHFVRQETGALAALAKGILG